MTDRENFPDIPCNVPQMPMYNGFFEREMLPYFCEIQCKYKTAYILIRICIFIIRKQRNAFYRLFQSLLYPHSNAWNEVTEAFLYPLNRHWNE